MTLKYYKTIEKDILTTGATWSDDWTPDEDLVIKRIHLIRKDGTDFTESTLYLKIAEDVYTHSIVPVICLGPDKSVSPELDIPVDAHQKISWTVKNNEAGTVSLFLVFECEVK